MEIGKLRERAGLTKTQLADRLGLDLSTVSKWESGVSRPQTGTLLRLADLLSCTIDELFGRDPSDRDGV